VKTQTAENPADEDQLPLFSIRSELAAMKEGAGAVSVETVLDEIAKLKQLRALGLPEALFRDVPGKLVTHYRQRAASEKPRELRRHSPQMRYTLLAALCWQRQREITDNLVELLIHIAHRVGVRAEEKVDVELAKYAKKIIGKAKLLYKLAKAAKGQPDGVVRDVIYPVVSEKTLEDLICEAEAAEKHEQRVKFVTRGSYSRHYRRIAPALLKVLSFQSNNDLHRPVMDALALIIEKQYDELIKFATALRLGIADAESILRRFTKNNVQHPTYKALCELGKALKTMFLCDYLRLESLRREIHEGLQVIENWNSANDFILYGKGGEFASNKLESQELLMLSLHLLQVSLVYVNTLMIQHVLAEPGWQGRLTAVDLRALSPLKWQHVNPYGTFTLNMHERLPLEQEAFPPSATLPKFRASLP
jgi:Tn3 transposase DDE domain